MKKSVTSNIPEEKKENKGSVVFQVLNFTKKIQRLSSHLELHKKDFLSERGLRKILGKRQKLLDYLSKKNPLHYNELIQLMGQLDTKKFEQKKKIKGTQKPNTGPNQGLHSPKEKKN